MRKAAGAQGDKPWGKGPSRGLWGDWGKSSGVSSWTPLGKKTKTTKKINMEWRGSLHTVSVEVQREDTVCCPPGMCWATPRGGVRRGEPRDLRRPPAPDSPLLSSKNGLWVWYLKEREGKQSQKE